MLPSFFALCPRARQAQDIVSTIQNACSWLDLAEYGDLRRDYLTLAAWELGIERAIPPFIHFAYNRGTFLELLYPSYVYTRGESDGPATMGYASRDQMLERVGANIHYAAAEMLDGVSHHYDGEGIQRSSLYESERIIRQYHVSMQAAFEAPALIEKEKSRAHRAAICRILADAGA